MGKFWNHHIMHWTPKVDGAKVITGDAEGCHEYDVYLGILCNHDHDFRVQLKCSFNDLLQIVMIIFLVFSVLC